MPRFRSTITTLALTAGLVAAAPAAAAMACDIPATTKAFAQFGDDNNYYLATDFESAGLEGTTTGSVAWSSSNDPFYLAGAGHTRSIRMGDGSTFRSTPMCVSKVLPHLRWVAKALSGHGSVSVKVDTLNADGSVARSKTTVLQAADHTAWAPTSFVSLDTSSMADGETAQARITTTFVGAWLVDDIYVDPYSR